MPYCPACGQEFVEAVLRCPDCEVALTAGPAPAGPPGAQPDEHVVDVFETQDPSEAEIVLGLLRTNDVPCSQHSGVPQNVLPLHVDRMEALRIFVPAREAERAQDLIASYREEGGAD